MPSWNDVLIEIGEQAKSSPLDVVRRKYLKKLNEHTGRNIIACYSGFLQFPDQQGAQITDDDKNGFMNVIHGMDASKGVDLLLHTPGGDIAAVESLAAYLHAKFGKDIRAIIPQMAMSAGTMLACACKSIVMGKQSNLGPFDPQFGGVPAYGILEEFEQAKQDILNDPNAAQYWQFIIGKYHPTFIGQCEKAIKWAAEIVEQWLLTGMLEGKPDSSQVAKNIVEFLNNHDKTFVHSRHFHIDQLRKLGLAIEALEDDQTLQDLVLTVHHCYMHTFGSVPVIKIIENHFNKGMFWNFASK